MNEDGTIIKSISYAMVKTLGNEFLFEGLEIKLDQPFIYIIRDKNKLPIFMGYIKDPNNN